MQETILLQTDVCTCKSAYEICNRQSKQSFSLEHFQNKQSITQLLNTFLYYNNTPIFISRKKDVTEIVTMINLN